MIGRMSSYGVSRDGEKRLLEQECLTDSFGLLDTFVQ